MNIYYHIFKVNDWQEIVTEQMSRLTSSGMFANDFKLVVSVVGDIDETLKAMFPETVEFRTSLSENDTLNYIRDTVSDYSIVLYLHTKGVTREEKTQCRDWRRFMEYFVIDKWEDCVLALVKHDACGVNYWDDHEHPHFSGNFWWAKGSYIKKLPPVPAYDGTLATRMEAEFWIGKGNPNVKCFKKLGQAFYTTLCPEFLYNIRLSILIASSRPDMTQAMVKKLQEQSPENVEILYLGDNKRQTIGHKRQSLLETAQGDYIVFVDDDDDVADDYVPMIMDGIKRNPDCFVFGVEYWHNGCHIQDVRYSKDFGEDINTNVLFLRIPNHIMVVKRELALKAGFTNKNWGEDAEYAKALLPHLKIQAKSNRNLYKYLHSYKGYPIDLIMLSKAKTFLHKQITEHSIESLLSSYRQVPVNIIVIEQNPLVSHDGAITIHEDEPFNYNRFMNKGFLHTTSSVVVFANNDLEYTPYWAEELLEVMDKYSLDSASPNCRIRRPAVFYPSPVEISEQTGTHILGHCLAIRRKFFERIRGFDEDVNFWASENAYAIQLSRARGIHGLVTGSTVNHLGGRSAGFTLRSEPKDIQMGLTMEQVKIYNKKYNRQLFQKKGE
jgi:hypothetical protein